MRYLVPTGIAAMAVGLAAACSAAAEPACLPVGPPQLPPPTMTSGAVKTRAGQSIDFTVHAGLLRVVGGRLPAEKSVYTVPPEDRSTSASATMSYYAYFAKRPSTRPRPLMFIWDGGPGTSTRSMLLNSFGPVVLGPLVGSAGKLDQQVSSNPDTLLDVADLVFVDAPGTGFGHLEGCDAPRRFYGVNVDAAAFERFIAAFVRIYRREASPIALLGESYGTTRAAVVANGLADTGTRVSAVVLISQLMALDAWSDGSRANIGTENAAFLTLPTYAATAWQHERVPHVGTLEDRLRAVEAFTLDVYGPELLQGSRLSPVARADLARRLAGYTGISPQTWLDADLRIEASQFRCLLEANEHRLIGREDTRTDGPAPQIKGSAVEDDPTLIAAHARREAAFDAYVRGTLKLGDMPFTPYIDGPDTRWDMHHLTDPGAWPDTYVNVAPDLVDAMTKEPTLSVLIAGGYFDLASPYFGGPYLVAHLPVPDAVRSRITIRDYPAPHSVYDVDGARTDLHNQIYKMLAR